jgi:hypothetical protein
MLIAYIGNLRKCPKCGALQIHPNIDEIQCIKCGTTGNTNTFKKYYKARVFGERVYTFFEIRGKIECEVINVRHIDWFLNHPKEFIPASEIADKKVLDENKVVKGIYNKTGLSKLKRDTLINISVEKGIAFKEDVSRKELIGLILKSQENST